MLRWFNANPARQFAATLCDEFARLRKSTALRGDTAAKKAEKFGRLRSKAGDYAGGLNIYLKARFIQGLREGLEAHEIPETEIAQFVQSIVTAPIAPKRPSGPT